MTPLFRHHKDDVRATPRIPAQRSRSATEAARSIRAEQAKLDRIKAQTPTIVALGKSLVELHEHNHIVENLTAIIGGRT